ncbi:glutamic acid-rich protein [Drosophila ficusphila]|uniref:glutamic acid-rich protein n=1 Tax=Drosophila ficusphila TaxID=30025 RepID=UPI0007E76361|nr:glutamic acid-rich protein [Drosophila ficusphila]
MIPWTVASLALVLVLWPVDISSRSYSNGLIFYELKSHQPYLPPTVSVSRGRNLASVKYSEKGSIWSTFGQPCECSGPTCGCCAGLKVDQYRFDQKVCANVSFVPHLEEAQLEVYLNGKPSSKYGISVRNPAPFCIPVMMGVPMAMCVQMTDVTMVGNNLNMCMDFVVRLATTDLFEMHFQCMRMGLDGLQYVDKNGNPVLPAESGQGDDPEEYEYAELEDQPEEYPSQEEEVKGEAHTQSHPEQNPPQKNPLLTTEKENEAGYPSLIIQPEENQAQESYQPPKNQTLIEAIKQDQPEEEKDTQNDDQGYQPLVHIEQTVEHKPYQESQPEKTNEAPFEKDQLIGYQPQIAMEPQKNHPKEESPSEDHQKEEDNQETEDHQEDEEIEEVEPLPIESEMLMAGDTAEEAPLEEEAEEMPTEDAKETEAAAEKENETEQNTPDNANGYSESGSRPSQVIETITNSIKATEAPTTTTTKMPTTTTTKIPKTTTTFNKPNIVVIDDTNNGEKTAAEEEDEGEKTAEEAKKEAETGEAEGTEEEEEEEEDEAETEEEATTLAGEMENDSDNEINVDDDDDEVEKKLEVKEPPSHLVKGEKLKEEPLKEGAGETVQKAEKEPEEEVKTGHEEKVKPEITEDTASEEEEGEEAAETDNGEGEKDENNDEEEEEEDENGDEDYAEEEKDDEIGNGAAEESADAAKPEESDVKTDENSHGYGNPYTNVNENTYATPASKSLSRHRRFRSRRLPRPPRKTISPSLT